MVGSSATMLDAEATVGNFEFSFDDTDLSDRILHIEIMDDSPQSRTDMHGVECVPNGKRKRETLQEENVVEVKTFHITAVIVAARSPFFYKLFKNGMRESQQRDVTLRIYASEEAALMELLKFMYSNTLSAATVRVPDLLGVLFAADKYQVISCMKYCVRKLQLIPMSLETALLYLTLPWSILVGELVQPLIDTAKQYLVAHFRDSKKSEDEMMSLPLSVLEIVLGSDGMLVKSENAIFEFILKWARAHYPRPEERRYILTERLSPLICFPKITTKKLLKEVLVCPDFDHKKVCKLVTNALFLKDEGKTTSASSGLSVPDCGFGQRFYTYRPIKFVGFGLSRPQGVVFLELKKEEFMGPSLSRFTFSEKFHLGRQSFSLCPRYERDQFALSVMSWKGSGAYTLNYEFEVMKKPLEVFESKCKGTVTATPPNETRRFGKNILFQVPHAEFMADESEYFIDGILHLRANFAISFSQA